jgi:hypothetical protein
MNPKKLTVTVAAALVIAAAVFTAAFAAGNGADGRHSVRLKNQIAPYAASAEQQEIIDLLSADREVLLYEYSTDKPYKHLSVTVKTFRDGIVIEQPAGVSAGADGGLPQSGVISVTLASRDGVYDWSISINDATGEGTGASHSSGRSELAPDPALGRAYAPITEPADIADGKEIVLYSSVFFGDSGVVYNEQTYADEPELLARYPYAQLVTCVFSDE